MSTDRFRRSRSTEKAGSPPINVAGITFVASGILFLGAGVLVIWADPPPSDAPVLGMLTHGLWALSIALVAIGTLLLTHHETIPIPDLAERIAVGAFGLGTVVGLQWVTWAYVDIRAAESAGYEIALETVITPFGAGHMLMYGILLGTGIVFLGWGLVRSMAIRRLLGLAGIVIGFLTVVTTVLSLLVGLEGGSDDHWLFNAATLLLPLCYPWAIGLGISLYDH